MNRQDRQERQDVEPSQELDRVVRQIVDAAIAVHRNLGPGLLESVYERCLAYEIEKRGISVDRQVPIPIRYDDLVLETGLRLDMLAAQSVIIEIKAVDRLLAIHDAQLLTYLKLSGRTIGLLINFNVHRVKDGIRRLIRSS